MKNNHFSYIELQSTNIGETKKFYSAAFNWVFTDYGPDYASFSNSGVDGGFAKVNSLTGSGTLLVLYHQDLGLIRKQIIDHGGKIVKDIFAFPGGKRFHFTDPSGNELAVWSEWQKTEV